MKNWFQRFAFKWVNLHRYSTARAESADAELDKTREQTEAALAEAEAYRAEAEAYRAEMDANVDRIERAASADAECKELKHKLRAVEEKLDAERKVGARMAAAAAAAEERAAASGKERDRLAEDVAEARASRDAAEQAAHLARGELGECRSELNEAAKVAAESTLNRKNCEDMRVALEAARWGCTSRIQLAHSLKAPGFNP